MDFLSDSIFSVLDRSDFIGGIDNEALDFGQLDEFMHVDGTGGVPLDGAITNNCDNQLNDHIICGTKTEVAACDELANGRVAVGASAPISTPTLPGTVASGSGTNGNGLAQVGQLPESPPDSSSEAAYSPLQDVHGLTLTRARHLHYGGLAATATLPPPPVGIHELLHLPSHQLPQPYALSHQQFATLPNHNLLGQQQHQQAAEAAGIRIKHEAGPAAMYPPTGVVGTVSPPAATDIEMSHDLMYGSNGAPLAPRSLLHYGNEIGNLYAGELVPPPPSSGSMLATAAATTISEAARVQVVGIQATHSQVGRVSAPTTPIHSLSRKRKMSTQLDCPDYSLIKPDPGLAMSPAAATASLCGTPLHHADDMPQCDLIAPVSINLTSSCASSPHRDDAGSSTPHTTPSALLSPALSTANSNADSSSLDGNASTNTNQSADNSLAPCIRFSPFQPQKWHKLCDQSLQDLSVVYYRVDADKGFNFSVSDDAFVCQKKNHFQITCHARLQGEAKFVKTASGLEKIKSFHLHFYGVKLEAPNQTIRVEQSQSDRSKKPFYPVPIDLQSHIVSKVTVGRLHFSETTNNNMRKKGRPNPEQRYFQLVVGLHVHTTSGNFPVISQSSERIIVRASNPGQFESDMDLCWQRGLTQDSICHAGRVGINTDRPDESLVVHGNLKVSGHIVQPSDSRAKQEIGELDTSVQLRNLQKIRIVRYRYDPEFAIHSGLKRASASDSEEIVDTGVIAQEVREVIPDAVQEGGSIVLPNGNVIENFLLVNKDRILMENIGAVKELCKVTGSLETRIEHLERANSRLSRTKANEKQAAISANRLACKASPFSGAPLKDGFDVCSNRTLQVIIFLLIIIMAVCLAAVSTLYFVEHNRQQRSHMQLNYLPSSGRFSDLQQLQNLFDPNKTLAAHWPNFLTSSATTRGGNSTSPQIAHELSYSEAGGLRNDEMTVVMEKPLVSTLKEPYKIITTTAPLLRGSNKTVGSKNKKWPLAQVVLRAASQNSGYANNNTSGTAVVSGAAPEPRSVLGEAANRSESSIAPSSGDSIAQDFENNSIDIDAQHVNAAKKLHAIKAAASDERLSSVALNDAQETGDADVTLKLTDPDAIAAASLPDVNSLKQHAVAGKEPVIYNIFRTVSPPTMVVFGSDGSSDIGAAVNTNYSTAMPPLIAISNKSRGVLETVISSADAADLQSLSGGNDSADNPISAQFGFDVTGARESALGRRSTSQPTMSGRTMRKTVQVELFGTPVTCGQAQTVTRQRRLNYDCQSICLEEPNTLSAAAPRAQQLLLSHVPSQNPMPEHKFNNDDKPAPSAGAFDELDEEHDTPSGLAISRTPVIQPEKERSDDADDNLNHSVSDEHLDVDSNVSPVVDEQTDHSNAAAVATAATAHRARLETPPAQQPPRYLDNCWKISSAIVARNLSSTIGVEDFCTQLGKSLNLTYIIPLSRYFKESSVGLHLSSATPLIWTICNSHEHTKEEDGKHLISMHVDARPPEQLSRQQNTSTLVLELPSRGYFVRDVAVRATIDLEKEDICEESASDITTLLQYNFRIIRDCD